jgi:hypothetical protein
MAHDVAHAIITKAQSLVSEARLNVELSLCMDNDLTPPEPENPNKYYLKFKNVLLETSKDLGTFHFQINCDYHFIYENFTFKDYEKALGCFLYQYVIHALYLVDISEYEVLLVKISDANHSGDDEIQLCLHLNFTDIPAVETDSICGEILDKITEPVNMIFDAWKLKYETI